MARLYFLKNFQDTVVALQALGAYAAKVYSKDTDVSLTVTNSDTKQTFKVTPDNAIVLQSVFVSFFLLFIGYLYY